METECLEELAAITDDCSESNSSADPDVEPVEVLIVGSDDQRPVEELIADLTAAEPAAQEPAVPAVTDPISPDVPPLLFHCKQCPYILTSEEALQKHVDSRHPQCTHHCDYCYKSYTKATFLKAHMRTHTDPKMYQCKICCRNYRNKSTLKNHMSAHSRERLYDCSVCNKNVVIKCNVNRGVVTHSVEER